MLTRLPAFALPVTIALSVVSFQTMAVAQKKKVATSAAISVKSKTVTGQVIQKDVLTKREREQLDEINLARTNPAQYVTFLEQFKPYYRDKVIHFSDGRMLVTNEGVAALDEAISYMLKLKPLPPFELRKGMILGAKAHVDDLKATGRSGHTGSDGSKPEDRLSRFGSWADSVGEDIVYDSRTARYDVIGLIIDDGTTNRGHRNNLFKTSFRAIGIAMGGPASGKTLCVITFAGGFTDKPDSKAPTATKY